MTNVDFGILMAMGGFALFGLWFGAIHMVGSIVGLIVGAVAAGRYYEPFAQWVTSFAGGNLNLWRLASVFIVYVLVNRLVGLVFWLVEKVFKFVSVIPFLKTFNRLLGAGMGLVEGTFVVGLAVWFAARFPVSPTFEAALQGSSIAKAVINIGAVLAPLIPKAVQTLHAVM